MSFGSLNFDKVTAFNRNNFEKDKSVFMIQDNIFRLDNEYLTFYNNQGEPIWEKQYAGNAIEILGEENHYYMIDKSVGDIFVFNDQGKILANQYSLGKITNIISHDRNEISFYTESNNLITLDGMLKEKLRSKITLENIIEMKKFNDHYYFLTLEDNQKEFFTRYIIFDEKFEFESNTNFPDQVFYDFYIDNDAVKYISDKVIKTYNHEHELLWEITFDGYVNKYDFSEHGEIAVNLTKEKDALEGGNALNEIRLYNLEGNIITKGEAPLEAIEEILFINNRIICYNESELYVLSRELEILFSKKINESIERVEMHKNLILIKDIKNATLYKIN